MNEAFHTPLDCHLVYDLDGPFDRTCVGIFSGSSYLVERRTKAGVIDAVNDAINEIKYDNGWLDFDDVDFRRGGAYIALYDKQGFRIAGNVPEEVPYSGFSDGILRTLSSRGSKWYIYDTRLSFNETDFIHHRQL